ncbi:MAG: hypothetical protein RBS80_07800 [Thermoguttaceae bacterium]|jgi:hypothetical protein|nr:hypothetical protein [Thermoguttaceae bacterium]
MKLPNGGQAFIDERKIIEYCLSEEHDEGKHKAHLFRRLVGIGVDNAERLLDALSEAAAGADAAPGKRDHYGQRYTIDFILHGPRGTATVRSVWIVRTGEQFPRLVSCFIL